MGVLKTRGSNPGSRHRDQFRSHLKTLNVNPSVIVPGGPGSEWRRREDGVGLGSRVPSDSERGSTQEEGEESGLWVRESKHQEKEGSLMF